MREIRAQKSGVTSGNWEPGTSAGLSVASVHLLRQDRLDVSIKGSISSPHSSRWAISLRAETDPGGGAGVNDPKVVFGQQTFKTAHAVQTLDVRYKKLEAACSG